jgi:hypothetical protein
MKFDLTNPQINFIKQTIERDLYNQTNQSIDPNRIMKMIRV